MTGLITGLATSAINATLEKNLIKQMLSSVESADKFKPVMPFIPEIVDNDMASLSFSNDSFETDVESLFSSSFEDVKERMLCNERNPTKHAKDIADRLIEKKTIFNEDAWRIANPDERLTILKEGYQIMAEESCLPRELIDKTNIICDELAPSTNADTNLFLRYDPNTKRLYVPESQPVQIRFNVENLKNQDYSLSSALETLYHESLHVMQQQCLSESGQTFTFHEMKTEWGNEIYNRLLAGNMDLTYVDYLSSPMETYAHAYTEYFSKMYDAKLYENSSAGALSQNHLITPLGGDDSLSFAETINVKSSGGKVRLKGGYTVEKHGNSIYLDGVKVDRSVKVGKYTVDGHGNNVRY